MLNAETRLVVKAVSALEKARVGLLNLKAGHPQGEPRKTEVLVELEHAMKMLNFLLQE